MAKKDELLNNVIEDEEVFNGEGEAIEDADDLEEVEQLHEDIEAEAQFDGSDEVFPFGPTYDQVQEWKSRYDGEIYMSDFNDKLFIWRPIRRKEFREIQQLDGNPDEYYIEEAICRTCLLWPEDYAMQKMTFGKAGIPTTMSQLIMERSGFLRPQTIQL